uniref:Uncharacterized protein n=2 Tax=Nothobranchius kuhntae TaxID=321403 RepID=A0A1A8JPJ9_NOTKU
MGAYHHDVASSGKVTAQGRRDRRVNFAGGNTPKKRWRFSQTSSDEAASFSTPQMPGQLDNLKSRKRKSSSEARKRKRCRKSQKTRSKTDGNSAARSNETADPLERLSRITCECHELAGGGRCSASPELEGREGKENELRTEEDFNSCRANSACIKTETENMNYEENYKNLFPDDDSNQILPVEQFFGNLDIVQDVPQRSPATCSSTKKKSRRRHYYAREDSDEEEVRPSCAPQDGDVSAF